MATLFVIDGGNTISQRKFDTPKERDAMVETYNRSGGSMRAVRGTKALAAEFGRQEAQRHRRDCLGELEHYRSVAESQGLTDAVEALNVAMTWLEERAPVTAAA